MKQNVHFEDFYNAFKSSRPNQFTYDGLKSLYDYLIQYEEDTGEELDLDVIALCCDYTEYKNFQELKSNYLDIKTLKELTEKTSVIPVENTKGFIIQNF
jgi:hypothetical protein